MSWKLLSKNSNRGLIGLAFAVLAITGGITVHAISQFGQDRSRSSSELVDKAHPIKKVVALGRLEPEEEVIKLFAPLALDGDRIAQLLVKEGEHVKAGQVVAILDSRDKLQDALRQAQEQVKVAQAKLAQVKAGAKTGEIVVQKATIEGLKADLQSNILAKKQTILRLKAQWQGDRTAQEAIIRKNKAELKNAQVEYRRYQQLHKQGAISSSSYDSKRLSLESAQQELNHAKAVLKRINSTSSKLIREAKVELQTINATDVNKIKQANATLNKIAEVRPVDVQAAEAEVNHAVASVKRAETDLEQAYIKALKAGQIHIIHTQVGEKISTSGIVELAQTDKMVAVAEVYQSDIGKVKTGQKAVVTSQAFNGKLQGVVLLIGLRVNQQNVFSNKPGENLDKRVLEVKIRLPPEDSKRVAGLTNLQVQTEIEL